MTSSCGFNHLPRHTAFGKLKAMSEPNASLVVRHLMQRRWRDLGMTERAAAKQRRALARSREEAGQLGLFEWRRPSRNGAPLRPFLSALWPDRIRRPL